MADPAGTRTRTAGVRDDGGHMPETRDSIGDVWGPRTPCIGEGRWPVRVDQRTTEEPARWVQSCCVLCSNGCGLDVGVRGRADDRTSRERLGRAPGGDRPVVN